MDFVIFDLDGTLVDSRRDIVSSLNFALKKEGFPELSSDVIEQFVGRGMIQLIIDALGNPTQDAIRKVTRSFVSHYDSHLLDQTTLFPGVIDFLNKIDHLPKAIVTNKPYAFSEKILKGLGVYSHFQWVIGGDSLKVQKPSPEILAPIREKMGEKTAGLIIGDSEVDIECGKQSGLKTCAVTFGFRKKEELELCKPDYMVDSFHELGMLEIF